MKLDRHAARILAMQTLVQFDVQGDSFLQEVIPFTESQTASLDTRVYARKLVEAVRSNREDWDRRLVGVAKHWALDRIGLVDRNIIRVGMAELLLRTVPPKVAIVEAIQIGREYGAAESPGFVNGVLDAIYKSLEQR